jgi:hypothetical protein
MMQRFSSTTPTTSKLHSRDSNSDFMSVATEIEIASNVSEKGMERVICRQQGYHYQNGVQ